MLQCARDRKLVLFLGAGFSKNISTQIPDASRLISIASRELGIDERLLSIHASNDYLLVAEYLQIQGRLGSVIAELSSLIHDKKYEVGDLRPHIQITEVDCSAIFTTNWDRWIETAFEAVSKPCKVIRDIADLTEVESISKTGKKFFPTTNIVKYHGDIQRPKSIVFSLSSYFDRIIDTSALDLLLETEPYSKSFLFIGYSFSDPNLRLIWYRFLRQKRLLQEINPRATFAPSFMLANGQNPIMHDWMSFLGISPISVDPSPEKLRASVEKLLDDIIGAQR